MAAASCALPLLPLTVVVPMRCKAPSILPNPSTTVRDNPARMPEKKSFTLYAADVFRPIADPPTLQVYSLGCCPEKVMYGESCTPKEVTKALQRNSKGDSIIGS